LNQQYGIFKNEVLLGTSLGTHWELGEQFETLMGTHWEQTPTKNEFKKKIPPPPPSQNPKEKKTKSPP
jgi:hypothetical protein